MIEVRTKGVCPTDRFSGLGDSAAAASHDGFMRQALSQGYHGQVERYAPIYFQYGTS